MRLRRLGQLLGISNDLTAVAVRWYPSKNQTLIEDVTIARSLAKAIQLNQWFTADVEHRVGNPIIQRMLNITASEEPKPMLPEHREHWINTLFERGKELEDVSWT